MAEMSAEQIASAAAAIELSRQILKDFEKLMGLSILTAMGCAEAAGVLTRSMFIANIKIVERENPEAKND
jgi:hypothetical protein